LIDDSSQAAEVSLHNTHGFPCQLVYSSSFCCENFPVRGKYHIIIASFIVSVGRKVQRESNNISNRQLASFVWYGLLKKENAVFRLMLLLTFMQKQHRGQSPHTRKTLQDYCRWKSPEHRFNLYVELAPSPRKYAFNSSHVLDPGSRCTLRFPRQLSLSLGNEQHTRTRTRTHTGTLLKAECRVAARVGGEEIVKHCGWMNLRERKREKEQSCLLRMEDGDFLLFFFSCPEKKRKGGGIEWVKDGEEGGGGGLIASLRVDLRSADRGWNGSHGNSGTLWSFEVWVPVWSAWKWLGRGALQLCEQRRADGRGAREKHKAPLFRYDEWIRSRKKTREWISNMSAFDTSRRGRRDAES